jgi:hypothetical protein
LTNSLYQSIVMDIPVQPRQRRVKNVPENGRLTGTGLGKRLMGKY